MDLATQIKLEDLKAEYKPLSEQLQARRKAAVERALQTAALDFKSYFEGHRFTVTSEEKYKWSARYEGLEFKFVGDDAGRLGCFAVVEVSQTSPTKTTVSAMVVNKGWKGPTVSISIGGNDRVAELQKNIDEAKSTLSGPAMELEFAVEDKQDVAPRGRLARHGVPSFKSYATFSELLQDRFK